jgi:mannose-6-phosphate isomerase-like protein (cupin superfamily)
MVGVVAKPGQVIRNPATGETVTFLTTTAESDGKLLRLEMVADPKGGGVSEHLHPRFTERHELAEGRLHVRIGGETRVLDGPARLEIPPMTPHSLSYGGDRPIRTIVEYEPPGGFESFLETVYALAADGKTNAKGMPNLLQSAVIAREHLDDYALPRLPLWLQRALFGLLAPIGRLAGYKAHYPS